MFVSGAFRAFKTARDASEIAPRQPKRLPTGFQESPKKAHEASNTAHEGPRATPTEGRHGVPERIFPSLRPQNAPRRPQETPKKP
eukprot:2395356-Pyramimonas_sp.AAC.1